MFVIFEAPRNPGPSEGALFSGSEGGPGRVRKTCGPAGEEPGGWVLLAVTQMS